MLSIIPKNRRFCKEKTRKESRVLQLAPNRIIILQLLTHLYGVHPTMKKLLFIVNNRAGKTRSRSPLYDAIACFSRSGYLVSVHETQGPGDATQTVHDHGAQFDLIVCAGGDGTLNETITGLMTLEERPPLGYLPNGSTNDFAASLHIPANLVEAALIASDGTPTPLDIGIHNDRYFAYVASFGAFTRASYSVPQETKNALGHFAYILQGVKDLDSLRPYSCRVQADEETFEGNFIFGAVCNSTSLGGLVRLDPTRVKMDDGAFELILLRMPKTPLDLQNLIVAMTRQQYDYPGVIFRHVSNVTVTTEEDIPWSLDGEFAPSAPRVEIRNLPQAIQLML